MSRLILLGLLLLILRMAWKGFTLQLKAAVLDGSRGRQAPPPAAVETLVRCTRCGTHVLASRALKGVGEEAFCSEECRHST